jgi:tRNA1(Val) A37 N6-methylase TrmN6
MMTPLPLSLNASILDAMVYLNAERAPRSLPRTRPAARILRSPEFGVRSLAIDAQAWLAPLTKEYPQVRPEAWVAAFAARMVARSHANFPERWLSKLTGALQVDLDRLRLPAALFDTLPRALLSEPHALGVLYSAALTTLADGVRERAEADPKTTRSGRAGRVSEGCVYTPAAVARMILQEVQVGPRRVVDPACGAGVFLIEAFKRAFARRVEAGQDALHAAEDALAHEVGGIDIDEKALAIAEFGLRMQAFVSAGLTSNVAIELRHADALTALPDLDGQCELIVGNPPFVEGRGLSKSQLASLRERFVVAKVGKVNLFTVFIERALSLLKPNAVLALVVPATFQRNTRYKALRELLLKHTIEAIAPLDSNLFDGRVVETVVLRVRKTPPGVHALVSLGETQTPQAQLSHGPVLRFCNDLPARLRQQISAMERRGTSLGELCEIRDGISTGFQPFPKRLLGCVEDGFFSAQDGTRVAFNPDVH